MDVLWRLCDAHEEHYRTERARMKGTGTKMQTSTAKEMPMCAAEVKHARTRVIRRRVKNPPMPTSVFMSVVYREEKENG